MMINRLRPDDVLLTAMTAGEGLAIAREQAPDLILMDIILPDMDGYSALEILRQDKKTWHIPVLAISALAMLENVERGLAAGFVAYVTKPVDMQELDAVIARHLPVTGMQQRG